MSELKQFQTSFLLAFQNNEHHALHKFLSNDTPETRLAIYQRSITGGLIKSLRHIYSVCEKLVGEDFFNALAEHYIQLYPSQSPDLSCYGAEFAIFIKNFKHTQSIPYLADICQMSWAYHLAALHPGDSPFNHTAFKAQSTEQQSETILSSPSSGIWITSKFPLLDIWQLCCNNTGEEISIAPDQTHSFIIWRQQSNVLIEKLTEVDMQLFELLHQKPSIEQLMQQTQTNSIDLDTSLLYFIKRGWIVNTRP